MRGPLDPPTRCNLSHRMGDALGQAAVRLQERGCCDICCLCWEAGISISSGWQGGIKLLNGPGGFWLVLMAVTPTIPVMSTA